MKKLVYCSLISIYTLCFLFPSKLSAQFTPATEIPDQLFGEYFDLPPAQWQMSRGWKPQNQVNRWYQDPIVTRDNSPGSATDTLNSHGMGTEAATYLSTPSLYVDQNEYSSFAFSFYQICYIDIFDAATVEYSLYLNNSWTTWERLPLSTYEGNSEYDFQGLNKFTKASPSDIEKWGFFSDSIIWTSNTDAWVREDFDMSSLFFNSSNQSVPDSFRVRLALVDPTSSPQGFVGFHRWIVDNFIVRAGDCELVPPEIDLADPPRNYPVRYEDRVYSLGPYDFDAQIIDASTIDTAYVEAILLRDVTSAVPFDTLAIDTFPMVPLGNGGNYRGKIEKQFVTIDKSTGMPLTYTVQRGDSIAWRLGARDATDCKNERFDPPEGFSKFIVINDLPKSCSTQPIYNFPYYQDFNGGEFGQGGQDILAEGWQNIRGDFHDWWVNDGGTPTDSTGPSSDYPGGGKYLYVEGTGFNDSTAYLVSPCLDFDDVILPNGVIKFFLNMNTTSIEDTINVDIYDSRPSPGKPFGGFVENVIPPITGNKGDVWVPFEFSTFPYSNSVTQLRFRGTPGNNSGFNDMAIDSFKIIPADPNDLRLNPVDLAPFSPSGSRDSIRVNIQNLGTSDVTALDFYYQVRPLDSTNFRDVVGPIPWTGLVPAGMGIEDTIDAEYIVPYGRYELKVWFVHPPDNNPRNDTALSRSVGLIYNDVTCHRDEFDGENYWVSPGESNSLQNKWELGTPNYDRTNTVISEPNAWDVLLNRPYTGTGITNSLISPFFNLSNADSVLFTFLNNRDIDSTKDGVWVEYSTDRGISWNFLENFSDPLQKKWYNNSLSAAGVGGTPVFADRTSCYPNTWLGWLETEILLPDFLDGEEELLFRFQFFAEDDDDGNDGMSIDNLLVYNADPKDLEVQYKLLPNSDCDLTSTTSVTSIIKNRGLDDVSTFEIEYRLLHLPTNNLVTKTDVINRTLLTRDTIHVKSQSRFDMTAFGDYQLDIIAKLPNDACSNNDTLTKMVENIRGCSFQFLIENSFRPNRQNDCDSSVWEFKYTSGDRDYVVKGAYNDPQYAIGRQPNPPYDTIKDLYVCIKDNSQVQFELNDIDTLVETYSFIAFNGENDTIIRDNIPGGPDSPPQFFDWTCPPDRSASPTKLIIDNEKVQLPVSKDYLFEAIILNNGLDSLDSVQVFLQIDQLAPTQIRTAFSPELNYARSRKVSFPLQFLEPGNHCFTVWTELPNGQFDQLPNDDTIRRCMTIMDTIPEMNPGDTTPPFYYNPFCENFSDSSENVWLAFNPYTTNQDSVSFERGIPASPNISPLDGGKAWVTNPTGDYPNLDESALLSPFLYLQRDSCYSLTFKNNFYITDSIQDGATVRIITKASLSNQFKIGTSFGDTNSMGDTVELGQRNWYNTLHILSIPDNSKNSGWTGISNGWINSRNLLSTKSLDDDRSQYVALMFRFESDGSKTSDGWAVDDICIENVNPSYCLATSLQESPYLESEAYLGQNIPNPADYSTSIPYYLPNSGKVEFVVRNVLGQPVFIETSTKPKGDGIIQLNLDGMSKGIYYYTMTYEGMRFTKKMIIAN